MNLLKTTLAVVAAAIVLSSQTAAIAAAPSRAPAAPMKEIIENEPQVVSSEEVSFGVQKPGVRKGTWIVVGAVLAAVLVVGLAAGGGGGGGDGGGGGSPTGDVSFSW